MAGPAFSSSSCRKVHMSPPLLELRQISKHFGSLHVLDQVSCTLHQGELLSLLGVSGAGKTTLFHIAAGLLMADEGEVFLEGKKITGQSGKVAYMLQKDLLLPHLKILDNVSLPLRIQGLSKKEARAKAQPLFEVFGLSGCEGQYPHHLSGGMAQRAAFLRTYLFSSSVALLDEPFSALDAITKRSMHQWYLGMMQELSLSSLLITHDIDEAITLSDRVLVLGGRPGRILLDLAISKEDRERADFPLHPHFLHYKKQILDALT